MSVLAEKVIVVTGGAGALGTAVVEDFRASGARVVVADLEASLTRLQPDASLLPVATDVADPASVAGMVQQSLDRFGRIDALICLAGGFFGDTPVAETPPATLVQQFELNTLTAYTTIHAVLPHMVASSGGSIVCVGSRPAVRPVQGSVAYAMAKLALLKLVELIAEEYRDHGIRANAVLPSIIDTGANRRAMPGADFSKWVQPSEIAAVMRFLVSDESRVVSGAAIPVYGRA
jgi:NAD(P)-dependent dehydrogenase (short-subunit alcohol dehydrogenase family)